LLKISQIDKKVIDFGQVLTTKMKIVIVVWRNGKTLSRHSPGKTLG
jgi:hypothetical protein